MLLRFWTRPKMTTINQTREMREQGRDDFVQRPVKMGLGIKQAATKSRQSTQVRSCAKEGWMACRFISTLLWEIYSASQYFSHADQFWPIVIAYQGTISMRPGIQWQAVWLRSRHDRSHIFSGVRTPITAQFVSLLRSRKKLPF